MNTLDRLIIEEHKGKQIIVVNYNGLKEKEMIELIKKHLELTLVTKLSFLADFTNCYVTHQYMVHARQFVEATIKIVEKGALLGIDPIKSGILKGLIYTYDVNFQAFETMDKAIDFLTSEKEGEKQ
jgi:hypothetical protein